MSQQKMFAKTNPTAVVTPARNQRDAYHGSAPVNSAPGSPSSLTAVSSAVRHLRHVDAKA